MRMLDYSKVEKVGLANVSANSWFKESRWIIVEEHIILVSDLLWMCSPQESKGPVPPGPLHQFPQLEVTS